MECISKVVRLGVAVQLGPENVPNMLAVEAMGWFKREELDYRGGAFVPPGCVRNPPIVNTYPEPTEKMYRERNPR